MGQKKVSMFKRLLFIAVITGITIYGIWPKLGPYFYYGLVFENSPTAPVDTAVVLSGGRGERVQKAADLYKEGLFSTIILTGDTILDVSDGQRMMTYMKKYLGQKQPQFMLENNSQSTYDNAKNTLALAKEHQFKSILIITSRYHTKRSNYIFNKLNTENINIYIIGAPDKIDAQSWWHNHEMTQHILTEWVKLGVYFLKS